MSQDERLSAAEKAAVIFEQSFFFQQAMHIAAYLATPHEFDVSLIIEKIWTSKKKCYLPLLSQQEENSLVFVPYHYGDALIFNQFKILEPFNKRKIIEPNCLDIVIVPLIAFDRQGNRLGTGGGFYDRTFAFLNTKKNNKPLMIGAAYAIQEAQHIPHENWDICLDGIITEREFIDCSK